MALLLSCCKRERERVESLALAPASLRLSAFGCCLACFPLQPLRHFPLLLFHFSLAIRIYCRRQHTQRVSVSACVSHAFPMLSYIFSLYTAASIERREGNITGDSRRKNWGVFSLSLFRCLTSGRESIFILFSFCEKDKRNVTPLFSL